MSAWNKETDFYLTVDYDLPEYGSGFSGKSKTLLIIALTVSLLIHLAILIFKTQPASLAPIVSNQSIDIRLIPPVQEKAKVDNLIKPHHIGNPDSIEPSEKKIVTSNVLADKTQAVNKPIEWLSAKDYQNISEAGDKKFNTEDLLAFNPGLKQLRSETRHIPKSDQDRKSIKNWKDIHGNQFYKVNGKCFMSPPQTQISSMREAKNWYSIACGGKSDSEKMMDNVNREMKARFKNP